MHHTSRDDRASSIEPDGCNKKDDGHFDGRLALGACLVSAAAVNMILASASPLSSMALTLFTSRPTQDLMSGTAYGWPPRRKVKDRTPTTALARAHRTIARAPARQSIPQSRVRKQLSGRSILAAECCDGNSSKNDATSHHQSKCAYSLTQNFIRSSSANARRSADGSGDALEGGWTARGPGNQEDSDLQSGSGDRTRGHPRNCPKVGLGDPLLGIAYGQENVYN
jgi:hypothetical protein